jgi:hypothetical protein
VAAHPHSTNSATRARVAQVQLLVSGVERYPTADERLHLGLGRPACLEPIGHPAGRRHALLLRHRDWCRCRAFFIEPFKDARALLEADRLQTRRGWLIGRPRLGRCQLRFGLRQRECRRRGAIGGRFVARGADQLVGRVFGL